LEFWIVTVSEKEKKRDREEKDESFRVLINQQNKNEGIYAYLSKRINCSNIVKYNSEINSETDRQLCSPITS
jgi:hypothetical protein